ncbi:MAG: peptidase MA family metallohydrolase [Deltaproteobacteria bacterium]|nr:peptidase MA family metallohydrolase [Deltaproteobacteria bacterium]
MKLFYVIFLLFGNLYRIESDNFIVEADFQLRRLADSVVGSAEKQIEEMYSIIPIELDGKITVRIAGSLREYEDFQPIDHKAPVWSVGIAYPKRRLIVLRGDATHGPDEILRTFRHELAHVFLHNFSNKKIPKWFSEGFSMYFEDRGGIVKSLKLIRQAIVNSYVPIDSIEESFPDDPIDIQNAYLTSTEFFSYLLSEIKEEGLNQVFQYVLDGLDFKYAIYKVSGKTISEMERDFKRRSRFRYAWLPLITSSTSIWLFMTFLFVYVYIIKKRRSDKRLELMRLEEELTILKKLESEERYDNHERRIN